MKKGLIFMAIMMTGYFTKAQIADSVLYEMENDTAQQAEKSEKSVNVTLSISDEKATLSIDDEDAGFEENEETDTIRVRIGNKKIIIIEDDGDDFDIDLDEDDDEKFKGHWEGFALGLNSYVDADFSTKLAPGAEYLELNTNKSWEVGFNFAEKGFNLINNRVGLVTGLGITFNNYKFDNNITLVSDNPALTFVNDSVEFSKNKLTVTYLSVPLLLEFQIPTGHKSKTLHLNAGIVGSVKLGSHTKQIYEQNNKKHKNKVREDFHLSPLRYGVHTSIGYGGLTFYGSYSMTTLFEKNEGPELYPFTIGIIIKG